MIDSTNPRIMADNIKNLSSQMSQVSVVKGNPSGSGFNTLLTKLQIGNSKYKLPEAVVANPDDASTGTLEKIKIGSGVYDLAGGGLIYSSNEHEVGKWIDDSVIYEKTISIDTETTLNPSYSLDLSTSITGFGRLISCEAIALPKNETNWLMVPWFSGNYSIMFANEGSSIVLVRAGGSITLSKIVITVRYIKS